MMKTPKTKQIFENAYDHAMPVHGEGWDSFADMIKTEVEKLESGIRDVISRPDYTNPEGMVRRLKELISL